MYYIILVALLLLSLIFDTGINQQTASQRLIDYLQHNFKHNKSGKVLLSSVESEIAQQPQTGYQIIYKIVYWCIYVLFLFLSAFRYKVGTDYDTYRDAIVYMKMGGDPKWLNYEPGFIFLNRLLVDFTKNGQILIIVTSVIVVTLFFVAFYLYTTAPIQSVFFFYAFYLYCMSFNIVRQFIAIGIFLVFIKRFINNQTFFIAIVVFVTAMFHTSALLLIPFYFFQKNEFKLRTVVLVLTGSAASTFIIKYVLDIFFRLFPKYGLYSTSNGGGSLYNIILIVVTLGVLVYIREKKYYQINEKAELNFYISAALFAFMLTIFSYRIVFFARASYYFLATLLFSIPFCWKSLKNTYEGILFKITTVALSLITFYHYLSNNMAEVVPYLLWDGKS